MEITRTKLTLIVVGSVFVGMALVIVIAAGWLFIKMGSDTPSSISFGGEKGKSIASAGDIAEEKRYPVRKPFFLVVPPITETMFLSREIL